MELTYNQIIKILRDYSTANYQINSFGNGDLWEVVEHNQIKDFEYPLMWVQDQPATTSQNEIELVFRVFFISLVHKDESNENEVKSDMLSMCTDLLSFWKMQTDYRLVNIDVNTNLTSFTERFNDELTGWFVDLKLTQNIKYDKCSIPMGGITPIPSNCLPATITINGESFTVAASGGITDIDVKDANGLAVGSKVGNEWIVPAAGGDQVTTDFNGVATGVDTPAGDNLAINVVDDDDGTVGTLETNSANLKEIRIANSNVSNSDDSYSVDVLSEQNLELPDDTFLIRLNGVLEQTIIEPSITDTTINITVS